MGEFPKNDTEFEDKIIHAADKQPDGTFSIECGGWHLWCGKDCPVTPIEGQTARFYGRGIGYPVRGLFIDGVKVWYRSDAEEKTYREQEAYGSDEADWLARWDAGKSVWTIEMGGMGPGYEQCIHITCAEMLRWLLSRKPTLEDMTERKKLLADLDATMFKLPIVDNLGLSGAQYGAAVNLAFQFYNNGPIKVMADERVKDRHIQVNNSFPGSVRASA